MAASLPVELTFNQEVAPDTFTADDIVMTTPGTARFCRSLWPVVPAGSAR